MFVKNINEISKEKVQSGSQAFKQVLIGHDQGPNFAMRRFIIEPGGYMPLHTNTVEHEQFVLNGRAQVIIDKQTYEVKRNDVVFIPSGVKHSYKVLGNEAFEFLCMVPNKTDTMEIVK